MTATSDPETASLEGTWRDTALPAAERAELLLRGLTLEEKVAQLGSRWVGNDMQTQEEPAPVSEPSGAEA